jgi:hypothetical protein
MEGGRGRGRKGGAMRRYNLREGRYIHEGQKRQRKKGMAGRHGR